MITACISMFLCVNWRESLYSGVFFWCQSFVSSLRRFPSECLIALKSNQTSSCCQCVHVCGPRPFRVSGVPGLYFLCRGPETSICTEREGWQCPLLPSLLLAKARVFTWGPRVDVWLYAIAPSAVAPLLSPVWSLPSSRNLCPLACLFLSGAGHIQHLTLQRCPSAEGFTHVCPFLDTEKEFQ